MRISIEKHDDITIVKISGDIKFSTCPEFVDSIFKLISQGNDKILLSLENVEYFDSSALGALISIKKQFERIPDGKLAIYTPHEEHLNIFRKINLHKFFEVSNDYGSAIENFHSTTTKITSGI